MQPALAYCPVLLAPGAAADAGMLGIEVSDRTLAPLCGLGNLDPQHALGAGARSPAAIEACLDHPLPPPGSRLGTIRPDLDSFGGMAILCLRAAGAPLAADLRARVARIAAVDRHDRGPWPGPRPLPRSPADLAEDWPGADLSALAACIADRSLPAAARVAAAMRWLLSGVPPESHAQAAAARQDALIASLARGDTHVAEAGGLATVLSAEPGALAVGYRLAPIVLASNPSFRFPDGTFGMKHTIARWCDGDGAFDMILRAVSAHEAGWGGQRGIAGSPQFAPSRLTHDALRGIARAAVSWDV